MLALRDRTRLLLGVGLVATGLLVALAGYLGVRNESDTALQLPYVLSAGICALTLLGLGLVAMRSQDDRILLRRIEVVERSLADMKESNEYLAHLLEAALLSDEELVANAPRLV